MIAYGKRKTGSGKIHPHNECGICGESKIVKNREKAEERKEIAAALNDLSENNILARVIRLEQKTAKHGEAIDELRRQVEELWRKRPYEITR